ncbi:MAG: alpha/beta fold hydrolase [Pseudonocardiaceae bacterium]
MSVLVVDDLRLHYEVRGHGPLILVPWCNFPWASLDVDLLADGYTVVIASPRGFGDSDRVSAGYQAGTIRADLEAVLDHLGVDEYIAFGYSMTGSVAPWLGHGNPRVRAVVSGGFPTTASYGSLLPYIERNRAETVQDPDRWATMTRKFDPDALLAWYHELDTIPPGGLVDRLDCPVYCFWGDADEVLDELVGLDVLRRETSARGIPFESLPGKDHEGMLADINLAIPGVRNWLHTVVPPSEM